MKVEKQPVSFFFQFLHNKSNNPLYYKFNPLHTINESLVGTEVIEFPVVDIVLPSSAQEYKIITEEQKKALIEKLQTERKIRKEQKEQWAQRKKQRREQTIG